VPFLLFSRRQPLVALVVGGRIAAPPITRVAFNEAPGLFSAAGNGHADRKTVITLPVSDPVSA
jgi:hypothetical protein